ncbi:MAG: TetR/AcrR family transcriptional regulator [Clostridiales bacterium]|jgi:AcrR family transcriptional regulator|nr:TetR/AcrR family transcriptional regulator [Clostridiales bacterium]
MYKKIANASAARSQQAIADSLVGLMYNGEAYPDITITDICKKANVVRKTFYRNFENKDDVVIYILEKVFRIFASGFNVDGMSISEIFSKVYNFLSVYDKHLAVFYKNDLFRFAYKRLVEFIVSENLFSKLNIPNVKERYYKYIPAHVASFLITTVEVWIDSGFADTPEELGEFTQDVFYGRIYK